MAERHAVRRQRFVSFAWLAALAVLPLVLLAPAPAGAAEQQGVGFSAADLATWQTNGVAWSVASAGGLVFVGGSFSAIRPPGAAAGSSETPRSNFAVFDAATGAPTSCAPAFTLTSAPSSASVRTLAISPDGKTVYVGGTFNSVAGTTGQNTNLAALDIATCQRVSTFKPVPNGTVRTVKTINSTVYFGGDFQQVSTAAGTATRRFAASVSAVGAATPGALTGWAPSFDKSVRALNVKSDQSMVVAGGDFDLVNGSDSHALVVLDPDTGVVTHGYPNHSMVPVNSVVKAIAVDDTGFYTGNEGTGTGMFDGRIAVDWSSLGQRWRDGCLGATQSVLVYKTLLYSASHAHDCTAIAAYGNGPRHHFLAEATAGTGTRTLLPWYPNTNEGIGEGLGPRGIAVATKNSHDYLWSVGEFTTVNGHAQQGLTRFGDGTQAQTAPVSPQISVSSFRSGEVLVAWRPALDNDDTLLTYKVYRDSGTTPISTMTGSSTFWNRQQFTYVDTSQAAGTSHTYRVTASDNATSVNSATSPAVTVSSVTSPYPARMISDGATTLLRYNEPGNVFLANAAGNGNNYTLNGSATFRVQPGAIAKDPSTAMTVTGTGTLAYQEGRKAPPASFTVETWFKTSTTTGGRIVGWGNNQVIASTSTDRQLYMTNSGQVVFGYRGSTNFTLVSKSGGLNNNAWHQVVATSGSAGSALYIDGVLQQSSTTRTTSTSPGFWRLGGDSLSGWTSRPSTDFWNGSLDETALYPTALTAATVAAHFQLAKTG